MPSAGITLKYTDLIFLPVLLAFATAHSRAPPRSTNLPMITEEVMKTHYTVTLAMLAGFGLGAVAVQGLHAQAKPPVYYIAEIETTNLDAYMKDYAPLAQKTIRAAGGRIIAGGPAKSVEGDPPKTRVVVQVWDSPEQIQAWRNSAEYKKAREIGDKLAKFRSFTVDGVPQ
jgi:uncharacterized protein (DUF1330 family)